jgi:hypothetical protein
MRTSTVPSRCIRRKSRADLMAATPPSGEAHTVLSVLTSRPSTVKRHDEMRLSISAQPPPILMNIHTETSHCRDRKDSCSSLLHLIESGVDRSRIELFHHDVDGKNLFSIGPLQPHIARL